MNILKTTLSGVTIIEPDIFEDSRGYFFETWQKQRYAEQGMPKNFVQDNVSSSSQGVLRGLHFQNPKGQGKLVQVLSGKVFDVAVDIRWGSPEFGQWVGIELSEDNKKQFYVPPGYAHGFCVLSKTATFLYKCTEYYNASSEASIRWDDPDLAIDWPIKQPEISEKDRSARFLKEFTEFELPHFTASFPSQPHKKEAAQCIIPQHAHHLTEGPANTP